LGRDPHLQRFLASTEAAILRRAVPGSETAVAAQRVFRAMKGVEGAANHASGSRLPVCKQLEAIFADGNDVVQAIAALDSRLQWYRRRTADVKDDVFWNGHANAMILGPGGLEVRDDVWIGVTLMAPDVVYVDHQHPPEEVYLALTAGEWWNSDMDWTEPGAGGLIYNPPGILHAMRSGPQPFLAVWLLPIT
jgi:quercetin dioxygenase-like cupin family protein